MNAVRKTAPIPSAVMKEVESKKDQESSSEEKMETDETSSDATKTEAAARYHSYVT